MNFVTLFFVVSLSVEFYVFSFNLSKCITTLPGLLLWRFTKVAKIVGVENLVKKFFTCFLLTYPTLRQRDIIELSWEIESNKDMLENAERDQELV